MSIFKSLKETISTNVTNVTDFTRGVISNVSDVLTDNGITQAVKTAKDTGKHNRIEAQKKREAKRIVKLEKKLADLKEKALYSDSDTEY